MRCGGSPDYRADYCAAVIAHMAEGASLTSFAADIGVSRATVDAWIAEHPDFAGAAAIARAKCAAWWERMHRTIAMKGGPTGAAQACTLGLKTLAADDWRERAALDVTVAGDLAALIAERRARLSRREDVRDAEPQGEARDDD